MKKYFIALIGVVALAGAGCSQPSSRVDSYSTTNGSSQTPVTDNSTQDEVAPIPSNNGPTMEIDQNKEYSAVLHTTEGDITIVFNAKQTPITVNNFVTLAKKDFYNGTIFHRVIKGFMIQGGDPTGTGSGGPGYQFDDEAFQGEYSRGTVAMANAGPDTNGSQFFIMHADVPLPKDYVIFGKVTKGMDVVDKIAGAPVYPQGEGSTPVNPVKVNTVDILEK